MLKLRKKKLYELELTKKRSSTEPRLNNTLTTSSHLIHNKALWTVTSSVHLKSQGRGGEELSTELSSALQRCLLGGKSGAGTST